MKRSIALLLALIMIVGALPATFLTALAHGTGVGVNNVQNLSLNNAPNQQVPATVNVDGVADDSGWKGDEWNYADGLDGIWDAQLVRNPDFTFRYQMHYDYQFLYGVVVFDDADVKYGEISEFTIWINNGIDTNTYTSKIILELEREGDAINVHCARYMYGENEQIVESVSAAQEHQHVSKQEGTVVTVEFRTLVDVIDGKDVTYTEGYNHTLSAYVSATIDADGDLQRLYHPRVDAKVDATNIDLTKEWPDTAVKIRQKEIYPEKAGDTDYSLVASEPISVDGVLDEEVWRNFTDYGIYEMPYREYMESGLFKYTSLTGRYSTSHYKVNANGSPDGHYWYSENTSHPENKKDGSLDRWFMGSTPGDNLNTYIPIRFKYEFSSDGKNLTGAALVYADCFNTDLYTSSSSQSTYFKVMIGGTDAGGSMGKGVGANGAKCTWYQAVTYEHKINKWADATNYHNSKVDTTPTYYSYSTKDSKTLGDYEAGIGIYASRVSRFNINFEFVIPYEAIIGKNGAVKAGDELVVVLMVSNAPSTATNAPTKVGSYYAYSNTDITKKNQGLNIGTYKSEINTTTLAAYDPKKVTAATTSANGVFESGRYGVLQAADLLVDSAIRVSDRGDAQSFRYQHFMTTEALYGAVLIEINTPYADSGNHQYRLWINNDEPQFRDTCDYTVNFTYTTDNDPADLWSNVKVDLGRWGDAEDGSKHGKKAERYTLTGELKNRIVASMKKLTTDDIAFRPESTTMYVLEYKIPLEVIGVTEKEKVFKESGVVDTALTYYCSVETGTGVDQGSTGRYGIVHPKPNNRLANTDSNIMFELGSAHEFGFEPLGGWVTTPTNIDGANRLLTTDRTNLFEIDGKHTEKQWNTKDDFIHVDSNSGSWGSIPDVDNMFAYDYKVLAGSEYIYGAAKIYDAAEDGEKLSFSIWINNDSTNGVDKKFEFYLDEGTAVCKDINGNDVGMVQEITRWDQSHEKQVVIKTTIGQFAMYSINGETSLEFMLSLEGLGIVKHDNNEEYKEHTSQHISNTSSAKLAYTDKYYTNKRSAFSYVVSVRKQVKGGSAEELFYPSAYTKVETLNLTHINRSNSTYGSSIVTKETTEAGFSTLNFNGYWLTGVFIPYKDGNGNGYQDLYQLIHSAYITEDNKQTFFDYLNNIPGAFIYSANYGRGDNLLKSLKQTGNLLRISGIDLTAENLPNLETTTIPSGCIGGTDPNEIGWFANITYEEVNVVATTSDVQDKFPHLADRADYNGEDRWDGANSLLITALDYYIPETIVVDGKLDDNGWSDEMWVEVREDANGNLQGHKWQDTATPGNYKYQLRYDAGYVYVAAVIDIDPDPTKYTPNEKIWYSTPRFRLWIKTNDKQLVVKDDLFYNGEEFTAEDAISFTHLFDITGSCNANTGAFTESSLTIDRYSYAPDNYVSWEPSDVQHTVADSSIRIDFDSSEAAQGTIYYNGYTLRSAFHKYGFYSPNGGNAKRVQYGSTAGSMAATNFDISYDDSDFFGYNTVVEENTITAKGETAYTDKDWYAKPEISKYTYGVEHGSMTASEDGTKTLIEFRFALEDIGCEDGDSFEYIVQAGSNGRTSDTGYVLYHPYILENFTTQDVEGGYGNRPYWYWAETAYLMDTEALEKIRLRNTHEPVQPLGVQYMDNYDYDDGGAGYKYFGLRFGILYNSKQLSLPDSGNKAYRNANPFDVKEIGMLVAYGDWLTMDETTGDLNFHTEDVDDYITFRLDSDLIIDQVEGTNMADYENYIFYGIKICYAGYDEALNFTYRGYVEYYPEDQIYYGMANKVFDPAYNFYTNKEGKFVGKPLTDNGITNPQDIPNVYTYRPTFYSHHVTRSYNVIKYASDALKNDTNLPDTRVEEVVTVDENGRDVAYIPLDDRPINHQRLLYMAEATGIDLYIPDESYFTTSIDPYAEGISDQGNPEQLFEWLKGQYDNGVRYFIISLDQLLSGGLVGSRAPFGDTGDTIATPLASNYDWQTGGYTLSAKETEIINWIIELCAKDDTHVVLFDTVMRLASTNQYADYNLDDYYAFRQYGMVEREQFTGNQLTISNILKNYNKNASGKAIATVGSPNTTFTINSKNYTVTTAEFKEYVASRERKLKLAEALYPHVKNTAAKLYIGFDDSNPKVTIQTNEGRFITDKLINGSENCHLFSGADELGMMGLSEIVTSLYGKVSANIIYYGSDGCQYFPADEYDTGNLHSNVKTHLSSIGGTYAYDKSGEMDILILGRTNDDATSYTNYTAAQLDSLYDAAEELAKKVMYNQGLNRPTIVVDCSNKDGYLSERLLHYHSAGETYIFIGLLFGYSQWNTVANSLGTAISNGIARYSYLKNLTLNGSEESAQYFERSHEGFVKATTHAWVKDTVYQEYLGLNAGSNGDTSVDQYKMYYALKYNNYLDNLEIRVNRLNTTSIAVGIDADGRIVRGNNWNVNVTNLYWPWDRAFEADFEIAVGSNTDYPHEPVYDDYKLTNIGFGKSYTSTIAAGETLNGKYKYYDEGMSQVDTNGNAATVYGKGKTLVDGTRYVANSSIVFYESPAWVGYASSRTNGSNTFDITVDLGKVSNVHNVVLSMSNANNSGIKLPATIQLLTKKGSNAAVLQRTITTSGMATQNSIELLLSVNTRSFVEADKVIIRFKGISSWTFISEIEVFGTDTSRRPVQYINESTAFWIASYSTDAETYIYGSSMTADDGQRLINCSYNKKTVITDPLAVYKDFSSSNPNQYISGWITNKSKVNFIFDIGGKDSTYYTTEFVGYFAERYNGYGYRAPVGIKVYVSSDKTNWTECPGEYNKFVYVDESKDIGNGYAPWFSGAKLSYKLKEAAKGRYLKVEFDCTVNWITVAGFDIFGYMTGTVSPS